MMLEQERLSDYSFNLLFNIFDTPAWQGMEKADVERDR